MNRRQIDHICWRVSDIRRDKERKLEKEHQDAIARLRKSESHYKIVLIQSGKAKLKKKITESMYVDSILDFPKNWNKKWQDERTKLDKELATKKEYLYKKDRYIQDELIMGDQKAALKMVREFEAM